MQLFLFLVTGWSRRTAQAFDLRAQPMGRVGLQSQTWQARAGDRISLCSAVHDQDDGRTDQGYH